MRSTIYYDGSDVERETMERTKEEGGGEVGGGGK